MKHGTRGSLALEATLSMSVILSVVLGVLLTCYLLFGKVVLRQALHQGLICIAEGHSQLTCENQIRKTSRLLSRDFRQTSIELRSKEEKWQGIINWRVFNRFPLEIRQNLILPAPPKGVPPSSR